LVCLLVAVPGQAADRAARLLELDSRAAGPYDGADAAWRARVDAGLVLRGEGRLLIETPDGLEFEARRLGFERRGPGSVTWRGRLADGRDSRAILSMEDGVLSGWLHTPFGEYEIRPLGDGDSVVLRMSAEPLGACGADRALRRGGLPVGEGAPLERARAPVSGDGASAIDVLALYTTRARDTAGGTAQVKSRIRLMIDIANETYANSRMSARLRLAHVALSPVDETNDMGNTLDALRLDPGVQAMRDAHSADLVALIQGRDRDYCGIAYIMEENNASFSPYAYSVTSYWCADTLIHEIGHNMGMEHDPANGSPPALALFPWAFGHFVTDTWRTVMAYPDPCGTCARIPNFSNPDVLYAGQATGIPGERDNARVGDRTAGTIANLRLSGALLADDFESGAPLGWRANRGGLTLSRPGLEGDYLLAIPIADSEERRFLVHRVPRPGKGLTIEFLFNANEVELGAAEVDLVALRKGGKAHTRLVLRQIDGQRRLSLLTRGNTGDYVEVGSVPVGGLNTQTIGIEWYAATDAQSADGLVRLTKNGAGRGTLRDLANDRLAVREVRLGVPEGAVGIPAPGRVYVDNYTANVPLEPQ
jgi:hypothetical protein